MTTKSDLFAEAKRDIDLCLAHAKSQLDAARHDVFITPQQLLLLCRFAQRGLDDTASSAAAIVAEVRGLQVIDGTPHAPVLSEARREELVALTKRALSESTIDNPWGTAAPRYFGVLSSKPGCSAMVRALDPLTVLRLLDVDPWSLP